MAKRSTAVACIAFTVSAWTLTLFLAFDSRASETRKLSGGESWWYIGEVNNLRPSFFGACTSIRCAQYCSGSYCANGFGSLETDGDWTYKGTFVDGRMEGSGAYENDNYDYIGGFKSGQFNGWGVLTCVDGNRYEGAFVKNKMTGEFEITTPGGKHETVRYFTDTLVGFKGPCD